MKAFTKNKCLNKVVCVYAIISFLSSAIFPSSLRAELALPLPNQFVNLSSAYSFPILKGLKFDPADPFKLEFIVDSGNKDKVTEAEASNLIKYFLAGLTFKEEDIWVNLSAYEKDRIMPDKLSGTDLGEGLLAQDYILKQISASLTYPESNTGKDFWSKTYSEVMKISGTTNLPINTFNKIWIVPNKAEVYEKESTGFIIEASLKAMLEEDYVALKENQKTEKLNSNPPSPPFAKGGNGGISSGINQASSRVMTEVILPKINEDINSGKNFATLRQIYYSLVLSTWFKRKFKDSLYNAYINKGKVKGIDLQSPAFKEDIYNRYLEAFKKGLYNYIKTDSEPKTNKRVRRRYFSGGFTQMGLSKNFIASSTLKSPDDLSMIGTSSGLTVQLYNASGSPDTKWSPAVKSSSHQLQAASPVDREFSSAEIQNLLEGCKRQIKDKYPMPTYKINNKFLNMFTRVIILEDSLKNGKVSLSKISEIKEHLSGNWLIEGGWKWRGLGLSKESRKLLQQEIDSAAEEVLGLKAEQKVTKVQNAVNPLALFPAKTQEDFFKLWVKKAIKIAGGGDHHTASVVNILGNHLQVLEEHKKEFIDIVDSEEFLEWIFKGSGENQNLGQANLVVNFLNQALREVINSFKFDEEIVRKDLRFFKENEKDLLKLFESKGKDVWLRIAYHPLEVEDELVIRPLDQLEARNEDAGVDEGYVKLVLNRETKKIEIDYGKINQYFISPAALAPVAKALGVYKMQKSFSSPVTYDEVKSVAPLTLVMAISKLNNKNKSMSFDELKSMLQLMNIVMRKDRFTGMKQYNDSVEDIVFTEEQKIVKVSFDIQGEMFYPGDTSRINKKSLYITREDTVDKVKFAIFVDKRDGARNELRYSVLEVLNELRSTKAKGPSPRKQEKYDVTQRDSLNQLLDDTLEAIGINATKNSGGKKNPWDEGPKKTYSVILNLKQELGEKPYLKYKTIAGLLGHIKRSNVKDKYAKSAINYLTKQYKKGLAQEKASTSAITPGGIAMRGIKVESAMDSRLRGNDGLGRGNDGRMFVIDGFEGFSFRIISLGASSGPVFFLRLSQEEKKGTRLASMN